MPDRRSGQGRELASLRLSRRRAAIWRPFFFLRECVAPTAPINFGNDPFPQQRVFPLDNYGISDTRFSWDYCFRAGIFCGDYENVMVDQNNRAWAVWTDARNGRSSRSQAGRNPQCEQSDVFADRYSAAGKAAGQSQPRATDELFLVTPCPGTATEPRQ